MRIGTRALVVAFLTTFCTSSAFAAQKETRSGEGEAGPVRVDGIFRHEEGRTAAPVETVRFALYARQVGGTPLWEETQNVALDADGRYSVVLGVGGGTLPLPSSSTGEPLWLGVHFLSAGVREQTRTLLSFATLVSTSLREPGTEMPKPGRLPDANDVAAPPVSATGSRSPFVTSGTPGRIGKFVNATDLGNSVMFESAGRIGLGTVTPADALHVVFTNTNGALTGYAVQNLGGTAGSYSGNLFYDQTGATALFQGFNNSTHEYRINNIAQSGTINFMLANSSRFLVHASGNIGINQTTPTYPLDILHGGSTGLHVQSSGSFSVIDIDAASGDAALRLQRAGIGQWNLRNRPSDDYLEIFELGGGGSRFVIQNGTGNVGIGETTNPGYRLDVLHDGGSGIRSRSAAGFSVVDIDAADGDAALRFQRTGVNQWNVHNRPSDNSFEIFEGSASAARLVIQDGTGFVGIGVEPVNPLHMASGAIVTLGGVWTDASSRSFKDEIRDLPADAAMETLRGLAPVTFVYKAAPSEHHVGFIAEDVPALIATADRKGVSPMDVTAVLTKVVQQQQATIEEQNRLLDELAARVRALETRP